MKESQWRRLINGIESHLSEIGIEKHQRNHGGVEK
jgi:hypothetical protein